MLLHLAQDCDHADDSMSLRDTVVREVHHRIKNHLQGVAGLLRQHADERPEIRPIMDTAITQIQAVAAIHGLQGKLAGSRVNLCDMVSSIASTVGDLTNAQIVPSIMADSAMPAQISESEAVAIALILNELIMNAVKHSPSSEDSRKTSPDRRNECPQGRPNQNFQSGKTASRVQFRAQPGNRQRSQPGPLPAARGRRQP